MVPTGVGRFISAILAGGGMVFNLDLALGAGAGAGAGAGMDGRGWVVERACGVVESSISAPPTSKWLADCDKSMSIVSGRYCLCVRLWLAVLAMEAVLLFRDIEGTGEVTRIALVLLTDPRLSRVNVEAGIGAFDRKLFTSSPISVRTTLVAGGDSGSGIDSALPSRWKIPLISRQVSRSLAFSDSMIRSAPRNAAFSSEMLESSSSNVATRRRSVATILFA